MAITNPTYTKPKVQPHASRRDMLVQAFEPWVQAQTFWRQNIIPFVPAMAAGSKQPSSTVGDKMQIIWERMLMSGQHTGKLFDP